MKSLASFNAASAQVATHPVNVIKLEWTGDGGVAAGRFLQVFDSATVPAEGSVPLKSWQINAGAPDYKEFKNGELHLTAGLYICTSSTEATKTLATDKFSTLEIELYDPERPTGTSIAGDLTTAVSTLQVWADAAGPKRLIALWITSSSASDGFIQIHSADTPVTNSIVKIIPIAAGATKTLTFGVHGLDIKTIVPGTTTLNDGCTIALSSTGMTYTAWGASEFTIKAEYK